MPIFEFKCDRCGKEFERVVFGSETDGVDCPECGSSDTKKQMSVFSSSGLSKDTGSACSSPSSGFS
jgi:putative FmdB family regulatory protein